MGSSQPAPAIPFDTYTPHVAIVTGAAQGIGYSIAHRLAGDGIDVAVNDILSKQKQIDAVVDDLRKKGRRAISVPGDVSSEADVVSIIEKTVLELGGVDIMVANAGITHLGLLLDSKVIILTCGEIRYCVYDTNVRGIFLCLKHAAFQMIKQGRGGRLIAASSTAGKQGVPATSIYSASKFAIRGLTQCAASELRSYGITVNTYAPGCIRTPIRKPQVLQSVKEDTEIQAFVDSGPIAEPEVVASIVSYFAKPESYFITGQSIPANGGTHFD